jgi:hypothetical protein
MPKTLQLKIILFQSKPMIWRTFKVTDDYRMDRFHQVIQLVMGWNNSHLHEFRIKGREIGMPDDHFALDFPNLEDETKVRLRDLDLKEKDTFHYLYDFGDSWEHILYVENISTEELLNPICLEGERACPPDDCGGEWGYTDLLEILKDKNHPEYEGYKEWLPRGFKPNIFPLKAVNEELVTFGAWHRKHPRKKSTPWHII